MTKAREERTGQVLEILSMMQDGARPIDLRDKLLEDGEDVTLVYATLILSRFRKKGYVVKRLCDDGRCRYLLGTKGERKLAFLQSLKEE